MAKKPLVIEEYDPEDDQHTAPIVPDESDSSLDKIPGAKVASNGPLGQSQDINAAAAKIGKNDPLGLADMDQSKDKPDGSKIMDYEKFLITPSDLQNAQKTRNIGNATTAIGNALGNQQSAGNFWLGRMNPHNDMSSLGESIAKAGEAPIEAKKTLLAQTQKKPEMQLLAQMQDPTSMGSKLLTSTALGAVSRLAASPMTQKDPAASAAFGQMKQQLQSGQLSGFEVQHILDTNPLLKQEMSTDAVGQRMMAMIGMQQQRLGQGEDRIASSAADSINKHPNITAYNARLAQIATDDHTLSMPGVINPVVAHEISQGLANAFQGGKGAGWNAAQATQIGGSQKALAEIAGWLSNKPYEALSQPQKDYTRQTLARVKESYEQAQFGIANQLYKSKINAYSHTPNALRALKDARDQYIPGGAGNDSSGIIPSANAGEGLSPIQQAAQAEMAKRKAAQPNPTPTGGQ